MISTISNFGFIVFRLSAKNPNGSPQPHQSGSTHTHTHTYNTKLVRRPWAPFQVAMGQRIRIVETRRYRTDAVVVVLAALDAVQRRHTGQLCGQQHDRHADHQHHGRRHQRTTPATWHDGTVGGGVGFGGHCRDTKVTQYIVCVLVAGRRWQRNRCEVAGC